MTRNLSKNNEPFELLELPREILIHSFRYLSSGDLRATRSTCSKLRKIATSATRSLAPVSLGNIRLSEIDSLETLDLTSLNPAELSESLLQKLGQVRGLRSLSLGRHTQVSASSASSISTLCLSQLALVQNTIGDVSMERLFRGNVRETLKSLSLRDCSWVTDKGLAHISNLTALETLDLAMCWRLTDETLRTLGALPHLHRLDLAHCERFTSGGLRRLGQGMRTLLMSACWQIDDECLIAISECLPNLECLGLFEAGETVTDEGLQALSSLSASLTALDLGYSCWNQSKAGLVQLLSKLRNLKMLNLGGCEGACDDLLTCVSELKCLTRLDISECQAITSGGLNDSLGELSALKDLNLGWNLRLSGSHFDWMASASSLTRIDFSFCGEISDPVLKELAKLHALEYVSLRKCVNITDNGIKFLACALALHSIDLSYCVNLTEDCAAYLVKMPVLKALVVSACVRLTTPRALRLLCESRSIRCLDASDNSRIDGHCLISLGHFTSLTELKLRSCPKVHDSDLFHLKHLKNLRLLDIELTCVGVSGLINLEALRREMPLLKIMHPYYTCPCDHYSYVSL